MSVKATFPINSPKRHFSQVDLSLVQIYFVIELGNTSQITVVIKILKPTCSCALFSLNE